VDKKRDTEELEFLLNNLEVLQPGGTCIAIVPMQCALAQTGKKYELKKLLLEKHTLEAVLSMPDELFYDSLSRRGGVVTCVMIFTAYKPHPKNKETYFGYYKDDGFVKRKDKGRIDAFNKWENIKAEWVSSYINRRAKPGFSVNKIVTADDEWCAEAYMETDYTKLRKEDFVKTLKEFVLFNELFLKKKK
ncbi:MAG: N-6 DNA methylase, partial [Patescibacteria group bacterium]